jgi:predicted RNase H-like HicB family nuclease
MKRYYAIFKKTDEAVEVEFPDLQGCFTFGKDWEEALEHAEDALAAWLVNAESAFIKEPSKHNELEHLVDGELVPILVDENIMASYRKLKRFNVIFPAEVLKQIDKFRKKKGLKRSTFLQKAAEEYLQQHDRR